MAIALVISGTFSFAQTSKQEILTNASIVTMKKMNLSPGIIKNKIATTPCRFTTDVQSLSELKNAGVDDTIIEAMITKTSSAPIADPSMPVGKGVLSEDKKTYVSSGGIIFRVGDPIKVNVGSNTITGEFKYITKDQGKLFNVINDEVSISMNYAKQTFTITQIYSARSSSQDMFIKNAPRTIYVVFETTRNWKYRIAIEAALEVKEVLPN